jgi:hypothetical protein
MQNGNTLLTTAAQQAVDRIKTLQAISRKTGIQTYQEQARILLDLSNEDALAVADSIGKWTTPIGGAR